MRIEHADSGQRYYTPVNVIRRANIRQRASITPMALMPGMPGYGEYPRLGGFSIGGLVNSISGIAGTIFPGLSPAINGINGAVGAAQSSSSSSGNNNNNNSTNWGEIASAAFPVIGTTIQAIFGNKNAPSTGGIAVPVSPTVTAPPVIVNTAAPTNMAAPSAASEFMKSPYPWLIGGGLGLVALLVMSRR